uniref:Uncharacterized protein n=1 Tax=Setaria viridis TaxID=4556 RepID=A0A4U6WJS7_SETVI|nr:hypothetical protein SEVIR_1G113033v2 [Setaria viridis]
MGSLGSSAVDLAGQRTTVAQMESSAEESEDKGKRWWHYRVREVRRAGGGAGRARGGGVTAFAGCAWIGCGGTAQGERAEGRLSQVVQGEEAEGWLGG